MAAVASLVLAETRRLFLARVERGKDPKVYPVDAASVHMPNPDKSRAKIHPGETAKWLFDASRRSVVGKLCTEGASAIDKTPARAIEAAMKLLVQYERTTAKR